MRPTRTFWQILAALAFAVALPAFAQDAARTATPRRLPPDAITQHTLVLPGRTLAFKSTAGTIKLSDDKGNPQADIAYVAYQLDGADPATRPVSFAFNGGPGAGSVWLHLGALGPWRLPMGGLAPSSPPVLVDNDDTWLDFTDLVFIDPAGTGYSQFTGTGDEARKAMWSVNGDIDALAVVVRRWLAANERLASPKFIVGESYGGFRGPRLAEALTTEQGIGVKGLVLVSPLLDYGTTLGSIEPFSMATLLPSFAATAREKSGPVTRAQLADVEAYAGGEYLIDFLRGPRDAAAVARMVDQVSAFSGLDRALVQRQGGRIGKRAFEREFDRASGKITAYYDASIEAWDSAPASGSGNWLDPIADGFAAPMTSAITQLYAQKLGWRVEDRYNTLNSSVIRAWDFGRALDPPASTQQLAHMLALDPKFRVLVTHGMTDLQTPYFATKLVLDQIPDFGAPGRLVLQVYGGGHMHYSRDDSRKALREDARRLVEGR